MLTNIPRSIAASARKAVLLHPNSIDCQVFRRVINRTSTDSMGGLPTLGGMGVLQGEDEADISYDLLGNARIQLCGPFLAASIGNRGDYVVPPNAQEAIVVSLADPGATGYFDAKIHDLVCVQVSPGVVISFTVEDVLSPLNMAPFSLRKLVLQPRDDLHAFDPSPAGSV
jgi:hypothetical protein